MADELQGLAGVNVYTKKTFNSYIEAFYNLCAGPATTDRCVRTDSGSKSTLSVVMTMLSVSYIHGKSLHDVWKFVMLKA